MIKFIQPTSLSFLYKIDTLQRLEKQKIERTKIKDITPEFSEMSLKNSAQTPVVP